MLLTIPKVMEVIKDLQQAPIGIQAEPDTGMQYNRKRFTTRLDSRDLSNWREGAELNQLTNNYNTVLLCNTQKFLLRVEIKNFGEKLPLELAESIKMFSQASSHPTDSTS